MDRWATESPHNTVVFCQTASKVFYCYAREDEPLRQELAKHLVPLKRQGIIEDWCDQMISPGQLWEEEINQRLEAAQIILLLISADFVASDYCYTKEMKRALERHEAGEARVIPIIMRSTTWKIAPFSKLQCLPSDARAVKAWPDRDAAFTDVAEGIYRAAAEIRGQVEKEERQRRQAQEAEEKQRAADTEAGGKAKVATPDRTPSNKVKLTITGALVVVIFAVGGYLMMDHGRKPPLISVQPSADNDGQIQKPSSPTVSPPAATGPAIQNIHGWPADKVQALQQQAAKALGTPVVSG